LKRAIALQHRGSVLVIMKSIVLTLRPCYHHEADLLTDFASLEALLHKGPLTSLRSGQSAPASGSMTATHSTCLDRLGLVYSSRAQAIDAPGRDSRRKVDRLAASCLRAAPQRTLCAHVSTPQKEKRQLYRSLKRLGLLAAQQLDEQKTNFISTTY